MIEKSNKILVLAPHTDDGELGCGGTIAKLIKEGKDVYYIAFSLCRNSLPEGLAPDTLEIEVKAATQKLGLKPENLILFDYDVRKFDSRRQDILEDLVKINKEIKPDLVFAPSSNDIHQDHLVISQEALRAFKKTSLLGYEMPWNNVTFQTVCFSILEESDIGKKIEALHAYKSQNHRDYLNENFIKSLATTRGVQIGVQYAEAFEVVRMVF